MGRSSPEKVIQEFGSKKAFGIVYIVTKRVTPDLYQIITVGELKGKHALFLTEEGVQLDPSLIFPSPKPEKIEFTAETIRNAAKDLAKRIIELKKEDSWGSKFWKHKNRIAMEAVLFGSTLFATVLLLPEAPLANQISLSAVIDIFVAFTLHHF